MPIISAVTPLVLGAFDLYRRRSENRIAAIPADEVAQVPRLAEVLQKRMQGLEESDLEQARLLSDLSKNVEALARAMESQLEAARIREARSKRWLVASVGAAALALLVSVWALTR